jgi:hypothetical protein
MTADPHAGFGGRHWRVRILRRIRSMPLHWRVTLGFLCILGGVVGFLPVLGFWMIPLGFVVLAFDIPIVRRWLRNWSQSRFRKRKAAEAKVDAAKAHRP